MKVREVGKRGVLFTFYDLGGLPTNVYLIDGRSFIFILDTFLGPESMNVVKEYIKSRLKPKPIILFNSHYHWYHIWGNCAFKGSIIISHETCRGIIRREGEAELKKHENMKRGNVKLALPGVTFNDRLEFHKEELLFFHSPGHTVDSSAVFDTHDSVLFAGDNIESPLPYITSPDLAPYIRTLEGYLSLGAKAVIGGHCETAGRELIEQNLCYLRKLQCGDTAEYETGDCAGVHKANMEVMKG
jgi:glyoxylase-like metal-dependent hydrolase (beta-lactamase superfamily II)